MGDAVPLKASYQGNDEVIQDETTALIGSDAASTIRIVRPGISRKHAVLSYDGSMWKIEDAGSRNGTFKDGQRIQILALEEPTTVYLGHPTDGESLVLTPIRNADAGADDADAGAEDAQSDIEAFVLPTTPPQKIESPESRRETTRVSPSVTASAATSPRGPELDALTAALRDQINAVKGLTWSVWAMIAVTAALAVMTLFVGVLGN